MTESIQQNGIHRNGFHRLRIRAGVIMSLAGFMLYMLGADPALFGVDRVPVMGFVQITVFLTGLAIICLGGYLSIASLWNGYQKTIAADIGLRLVATGFIIAVASGMADLFGFGGQPFPRSPTFGAWQEVGVLIGEAVIALGFLLLLPLKQIKED
jgi:hypothetical protein